MGLSYKREGERIVGRYIKAEDSRVLEKVRLTEFSFKEISSTPVSTLDNVNSNIMRTELHSTEEIHAVVREHESVDMELRNEENIRPPLQPIDFTHEWRAIKDRATKKRDLKMEDDDEYEFEMALQKLQDKDKRVAEAERKERGDDSSLESAPVDESAETTAEDDSQEENDVGQSFKFKSEADEPQPDVDAAPDTADIGDIGDLNLLGQTDDNSTNELSSSVKKVDEGQAISEDKSEDFIPVQMGENESFDQSEQAASEVYKTDMDVKKEYALQLEDAFNEAKSKGYEDGFAHGEEKAAIQVQQNATEVVNNLGQVVSELEGLKKTILDNTQENFYEIAQAVAESLVRREFSVNPQTFADVLRKAIADFVPDDEIKIAVHPDTFSKLMSIELEGLKDKIVKDENIQVGDFRIDSNLSVVDGNVKEMIRELLEQADLQIFADDKDDKVG